MPSQSDNIEIMINDKLNKIEPLLQRYQIWLEKSMKFSGFIFDYVI